MTSFLHIHMEREGRAPERHAATFVAACQGVFPLR